MNNFQVDRWALYHVSGFYEPATQYIKIEQERLVFSVRLSFARSRPLTTGHQMVLGTISDAEILQANPNTYVVDHV